MHKYMHTYIHKDIPPIKTDAPHLKWSPLPKLKNNPRPSLKRKAPFHELIASNFTIKWTLSQAFFDSILSPPFMLPPCIDLSHTPSPPFIKFWRAPHVLNTCGKPWLICVIYLTSQSLNYVGFDKMKRLCGFAEYAGHKFKCHNLCQWVDTNSI